MSRRAFAVGVGVNLGDRSGQFELAIRLLDGTPGIEVLRAAEPLRTTPVVPSGEESRHPWYLNSVIVGLTTLAPRALMSRLLAVETTAGRRRRGRCDPRTLDLDLVVMEGIVIAKQRGSIRGREPPRNGFRLCPPVREVLADTPNMGGGPAVQH